MIANWKEKVGGMKESPVDPRDYQVSYKAISLPEEYNTNPSNYIHNQGSYNNCAAHALSSYIEILLKSKDEFKEVSFPWLYGNRRHTTYKDEGLISRDLLKASQKDGNLYLKDYSKIEEKTFWKFGRQDMFPDAELKVLFQIQDLGQSRANRKDAIVPFKSEEIDKFFE